MQSLASLRLLHTQLQWEVVDKVFMVKYHQCCVLVTVPRCVLLLRALAVFDSLQTAASLEYVGIAV